MTTYLRQYLAKYHPKSVIRSILQLLYFSTSINNLLNYILYIVHVKNILVMMEFNFKMKEKTTHF